MLFLAAMTALPLTSCDSSTEDLDNVTLQLNWYHDAEFAGFYMAQAKGFYEDENLEVTLEEGGLEVNAKNRMLEGEVEFALTTFAEHQGWVAKGRPSVAVMAAFQIPPHVLISLADSGIDKPQDMIGRRVAIKGKPWRDIIQATLTNAGIDVSEIIEVEVESDAIEMLYNGDVDVWTGLASNEPIQAQQAGYEVNLIFSADYGVGSYEELLIVHQDLLDQNPSLVDRFIRASLRGWHYALEHPDEAAEVIAQWEPDLGEEFHRLAIRALIDLVDTPHAPIGWIDDERWRQSMGTAYTADWPGYTMQFVEEAQ